MWLSYRAAVALILVLFPLSQFSRADYLEVRRSAKVKRQANVNAATIRRVQPPLALPLADDEGVTGFPPEWLGEL